MIISSFFFVISDLGGINTQYDKQLAISDVDGYILLKGKT